MNPDEEINRAANSRPIVAPDGTAARVALWRALHVQVDPPPHILDDEIGLKLLEPDDSWQRRSDMDPQFTKPFRASIVGRSRFIEDLVMTQARHGVDQYVILGAGLDSFAQRRRQMGSRLKIFEIDRSGPQAWKRQRLIELGFGIPNWLRFIPFEFREHNRLLHHLKMAGFDHTKPAVVASGGVSMYLSKDVIAASLRELAGLAAGSSFVMTFLLPIEFADAQLRAGFEAAQRSARATGTPFISFFTPSEILTLARAAGFGRSQHVSAEDLAERYFADRSDGLRPPANCEEFLVATTGGI